MSVLGRRGSVASLLVVLTCMLSTAAWCGGAGFGDDDDNSEEEGPSYFGFVKDTNGATVPDAKVTVGVKDRGGVVTRTDALGAYKVPGFGKEKVDDGTLHASIVAPPNTGTALELLHQFWANGRALPPRFFSDVIPYPPSRSDG